jgi:MurNAc alpha-1-phosphate uridylyltransferase
MVEARPPMNDLQAVILAGGLATRMRPRTLTTPKFLLPVAGRPFGAWLLERLASCGYTRALVCIAHLGDEIRAAIGDGRAFGLDVTYTDEGDRLLGTAGAIRQASNELASEFLVTYGDSYLPFDYAGPVEFLRNRSDADAVMAVYRNQGQWDASNTSVRTDERGELWVDRYEKGTTDRLDHIDYGATALRRDVILGVPEDTPWGLDRIQGELARARRLRAYLAHARFFEIGSETGLLELERELTARPPDSPKKATT